MFSSLCIDDDGINRRTEQTLDHSPWPRDRVSGLKCIFHWSSAPTAGFYCSSASLRMTDEQLISGKTTEKFSPPSCDCNKPAKKPSAAIIWVGLAGYGASVAAQFRRCRQICDSKTQCVRHVSL